MQKPIIRTMPAMPLWNASLTTDVIWQQILKH